MNIATRLTSNDGAELQGLTIDTTDEVCTALAEMRIRKDALKIENPFDLIKGIRIVEENTSLIPAVKNPPVNHVPFEIMAEIFVQCVFEDLSLPIQPQNAPLLLLQVSRYWRSVALGTPRLFSSLYIDSSSHVNAEEIIPMWLSRSGIFSMDIVLDFNNLNLRNMVSNAVAPHIAAVWKLLNKSACRIRILRIDGIYGVDCLQMLFPPGSTTSLSRLQDFHATVEECYDTLKQSDSPVVLGRIQATPELLSWKLVGSSQSPIPPQFPSIIANNFYLLKDLLSTYHCKNLRFSLFQHIHFLHFFPNLVEIDISAYNPHGGHIQSPSQPILLPRLRIFKMEWDIAKNEGAILSFLGELHAPLLEVLHLQCTDSIPDESCGEGLLVTLLYSPCAGLRELSLNKIVVEANTFLTILDNLAGIECLSLTSCRIGNEVMGALVWTLAKPVLCPKLASLSLIGKNDFAPTSLIQVVRSRTKRYVPLRKPQKENSDTHPIIICEHLRRLEMTEYSHFEKGHVKELRRFSKAVLDIVGLKEKASNGVAWFAISPFL